METEPFPAQLSRLVAACGLSVPRLAELAGVSKPTVYAILDGHEPRPATRDAILRALGRIVTMLAEVPAHPVEYPGVDDLAADSHLLASLGATAGDVARVRELLGTRQGALVVLAAVLAGRGGE